MHVCCLSLVEQMIQVKLARVCHASMYVKSSLSLMGSTQPDRTKLPLSGCGPAICPKRLPWRQGIYVDGHLQACPKGRSSDRIKHKGVCYCAKLYGSSSLKRTI